jgi:hypothetical protein
MTHAGFIFLSVGLAVGLFGAMLFLLEVGRRIGVERARTRGSKARAGVGVVDGAVYGLLALLIGFSFSGAAERFDHRRVLVGEIANAASTAWKRIDALPDGAQPPIRDGMRRYMDELIKYYTAPAGPSFPFRPPPSLTLAEDELWSHAVAACKAPGGQDARMLLLPALNETFDQVDRERMARRIHPPALIFVMLGISALATALFAGYGMASGAARNWVFSIGIAASVSIAVYVIIELEFPRLGLFRVGDADQALVEFRATMK